jgi:hypothetical protein
MTLRSPRTFTFLTAALMAGMLAGCNRPVDAPVQSQSEGFVSVAGIYPHTESFRSTRQHGELYLKSKETCKTCHGSRLDGGTAKVSCNRCHAVYPHSDLFKSTAAHGASVFAQKGASACLTCHALEMEGPGAKPEIPSCLKCHTYPHPTGWALPKNHGPAFVQAKHDKKASPALVVGCLDCHGDAGGLKKRHPEQFVSCESCHTNFPHPEGFEDLHQDDTKGVRKAHPEQAFSCFHCHTDSKTGGLSEGCLTCHSDDTLKLKMQVKEHKLLFDGVWDSFDKPAPPHSQNETPAPQTLVGKVMRVLKDWFGSESPRELASQPKK